MNSVVSKDGTVIACQREGMGPAVILMTGALDDGSENAPLAAELAPRFTVWNYARRGRGNSGDASQYAVTREIEDLQALLNAAGGSAHVYGVSSGGMFALEAAASGLAINKLAVYEVPYDVSADGIQRIGVYRDQLGVALAAGRRGQAVELFMRLAGSSDDEIAGARSSPYWSGLEALAHTLLYDAACYGPPPVSRLETVPQATLVLTGGMVPFFEQAADAIAASVRQTTRLVLDGQPHVADPKVLAGVLINFFGA